VKLGPPPPAGKRYREDPLFVPLPLPDPDPLESWRPTPRPDDPHELVVFKRTGGAFPRRMWHMLFVVAAYRLGVWAGPRELAALHEDWAVLMGWWRQRPPDGDKQRAFVAAAFEELLARPRPPKPRRQKRLSAVAPRILLVEYDFCRQYVATLRKELERQPLRKQEMEWPRRLIELANDLAIPPSLNGLARSKVPPGTLRRIASIDRLKPHGLRPAYLRKLLKATRRTGTQLVSWIRPPA
jgi:hypothetical protein